ncbi:MAG: DUF1192 domain-containing protein [Rhizobium sp.]|jgi:uncharacterized small protein (DUF1192 family)
MSIDNDERPRKPVAHEIGCDLSTLSAEELTARIGLLETEIARLDAERKRKQAGKQAAEGLFRTKV